MQDLNITFLPMLPVPFLWALSAVCAAAIVIAIRYRLRGWPLRALAFAILILALAGPNLRSEKREGLPNVAFLVTDRSDSTTLEDRAAQIEAAAEELSRAVSALASPRDPLELVTIDVTSGGQRDRGTQMLTALDTAAARFAPGQIAGAILLSDGQVHDDARFEEFPAPVHALIAGERDAFDLRLALERAPAFGIVGEEVIFQIRAEAVGDAPAQLGARMPATVSIDGGSAVPIMLNLDRPTDLTVAIEHGGATVVDIQLVPIEGELTTRNNRIISTVNGVRDRLRVLLVSGEPHPGGRTWRDLLKSDPTVELIHFTILRPPAKQDGTPVSELSLIAFPTRELFLEKIDGFDLIVFDRYRWRGVLSSGYLANVARYVEDGGAILVASGPAFSGAQSLSRTPLADVLPAEPTVNVIEQPYVPRVTDLGQRHPVTSGLEAAAGFSDGVPNWGRWLRQIEVDPQSGHTVMAGVEDRPLLMLDRVGRGRVALIASDHAWLWSRGYDGGGPQADLLRRVAHWLMREPELEEEALFAFVEGERVLIERRSLDAEGPDSVTATPPDGSAAQVLQYEAIAPGRWQAVLDSAAEGLWRLEDGETEAVAAVGPPSPIEFTTALATEEILAPLVAATGGAVRWLEDGVPDVRLIREGRRASSRSWIGLETRDAYRVTGVDLLPLLPPWLAALAVGLLLLAGWLREGR
ncbi:MAG: glutamine amidotransferase [Pseudomonadota bacterium]